MEFLVETGGKICVISKLVNSVSWKDTLNDGCSKLDFSFVDKTLNIANGDTVRFVYDDVKYFGKVWKNGTNKKLEKTITSYDQLRRAKVKDTIVCKKDTVTTLTAKMCDYLGFTKGDLLNTVYQLPISVQDDKTWLDIIYGAIKDTLISTGKQYLLRDEFGKIMIRSIEDLQINLILGDGSLCYDYEYTKSIDDNFYNLIKLARDNESSGKRDVFIAKDSNSIAKYGLIQYFEVVDKKTESAQVKNKADMLLGLYNNEAETLTLNCLGDTRVRAGSSFYARIEDIEMNKRLIVKSVTHEFLPVHTMQIEVML
ncbi:MAG: phage protein [Herbinix sp.]|jgi:hypothetical protein|nr:phage protein [Herbinix sp.]